MVGEMIARWIKENRFGHRRYERLRRHVSTNLLRIPRESVSEVLEKKKEWVERGVDPNLSDMGVLLAMKWADKLADWYVRTLKSIAMGDRELEELVELMEEKIEKELLRFGLDRLAEKWIKSQTT